MECGGGVNWNNYESVDKWWDGEAGATWDCVAGSFMICQSFQLHGKNLQFKVEAISN